VDQIDGHCKDAVAVGDSFAAKKIPANQRGAEFGDVVGVVEAVG
jgi:hypothetical protein